MALARDLAALGWSGSELARHLCVGPTYVREWVNGEQPLPPEVADYVAACLTAISAIHPPRARRTNNLKYAWEAA
jgi:DNA-binding transcriptional regulator YdaS (Cro superfamily)